MSRGNFETLLIVALTFRVCFFTKRETEALLADAALAHFPLMVPNRQVKTNYCVNRRAHDLITAGSTKMLSLKE